MHQQILNIYDFWFSLDTFEYKTNCIVALNCNRLLTIEIVKTPDVNLERQGDRIKQKINAVQLL